MLVLQQFSRVSSLSCGPGEIASLVRAVPLLMQGLRSWCWPDMAKTLSSHCSALLQVAGCYLQEHEELGFIFGAQSVWLGHPFQPVCRRTVRVEGKAVMSLDDTARGLASRRPVTCAYSPALARGLAFARVTCGCLRDNALHQVFVCLAMALSVSSGSFDSGWGATRSALCHSNVRARLVRNGCACTTNRAP